MIRKFLLLLCLTVNISAYGFVGLIDILANGVVDSSGNPLSSGTVTFYVAGTTTLKTAYQEYELTNALANPATLDAAGKLVAYIEDRVKLLIKDSDGNTIHTLDDVNLSDADLSSAVASIIAGDGLSLGEDGTLDVNVDTSTISISSDKLVANIPTGTIIDYAGTTAPTGWLLCYGQAVSSATYGALYAVIGTTYGGDGSPNFNLPDLRGRVIAGKDDMGGSAASRITSGGAPGIDGTTLGDTGGVEEHTITEAELDAHTHAIDFTSQSQNNDHQHLMVRGAEGDVVMSNSVPIAGEGSPTGDDDYILEGSSQSPDEGLSGTQNASHQHQVTGTSASTGSGSAHTNVQPTIILNKIIKT